MKVKRTTFKGKGLGASGWETGGSRRHIPTDSGIDEAVQQTIAVE